MNTNQIEKTKSSVCAALAFLGALLASSTASAQSTACTASGTATSCVFTAARLKKTLANGTKVPMWGYCDSASVAAHTCTEWAPGPTISVNAGDTLSISLANQLGVPTSLVVLGQLGGGLEATGGKFRMPSPAHSGQSNTTFPGNAPGNPGFKPPGQGDRISSFGTEVAAGSAGTTLTWSGLSPGTYLYESGTMPSLQVPMGLYGVLVVKSANGKGQAYASQDGAGINYDAEAALLFSEIDPVQNAAVDAATGPASYPAAVNYAPTWFLINGKSFDETAGTGILADGAYLTGNVLVRLLNAGSRTHVPSIVGLDMRLVGEDGNPAPGNPKVQSEVLLTAGKAFDVLVTPPVPASGLYAGGASAPAYLLGTYPVFDRELSLSSGNQGGGGMQGYLVLNNAAASQGVCSTTGALCSASNVCAVTGDTCVAGSTGGPGFPPGAGPAAAAFALDDRFGIPFNTPTVLHVTANDIRVTSVTVGTGPAHGTLALNTDGISFTYTPDGTSLRDSFTYSGNLGAAGTATVMLTIASVPTAGNFIFTSAVAGKFNAPRPGVLAAPTNDPAGFLLSVANPPAPDKGTCGSLALNADGSFSVSTATPADTTCAFTYSVQNSVGTASATPGNVTVNFAKGSGLKVAVVDAMGGYSIADYRWVLQEDLTFKHDTSQTPQVSDRTVGTSFHRSYMPVIASGCVGPVSCGSGQAVRQSDAATAPLSGTILGATVLNGLVTVTATAHGLTAQNTLVQISGLLPADYNGAFPVTLLGPNQFTYQLAPSGGLYSFTNALGKVLTGNLTSVSESSGTFTVTTDNAAALPSVGDAVTIAGVAPGLFNPGLVKVTARDPLAGSFNYAFSVAAPTGAGAFTDSVNGTIGSRHVVTDAEALARQTLPGDVALDPTRNYYVSILPGDGSPPAHAMGGAEIHRGLQSGTLTIRIQGTPLPTAQMSLYIYDDSSPTNGQNEPDEAPLGGFNIVLFDPAGRTGDVAGQQTFDAFNMPLSNALVGTPGCPDESPRTNGSATAGGGGPLSPGGGTNTGNFVGMIFTCPNDPNAGTPQAAPAKYALAGYALIKSLTPARYDVLAHPGAAREAQGERWWQVETLEGTYAQDAFVGINEPTYFQEFGPPGPHVTIGFVNPDKVEAYRLNPKNGVSGGTATIQGKITNEHLSRPSNVKTWDSGTYAMLFSTTCQVVLNSQGGDGNAIKAAQCDSDGNFILTDVPVGDYEVAVFDQWLDQIVQANAVSVTLAGQQINMGDIPVLSWFTQYDQNIFMDLNGTADYSGTCHASATHCFSDADCPALAPVIGQPGVADTCDKSKKPGISNLPLSVRFRNGAPSNTTLSDSNGNAILVELFPLFNWYVAEADTTRFKQTGVHIYVDGGGRPNGVAVEGQPPVPSGPGTGLWNSTYATGESSERTEIPGAQTYGLQSFISQRNRVDWGRAPYLAGENGGILGTVVYSSTRAFDDQRLSVQTLWEPLLPRVRVNLYREETLSDGSVTRTLIDSTKTTSFDDFVNLVYDASCGPGGLATVPAGCPVYLLGVDGRLFDPATGAQAPNSAMPGRQVNLQCPGQSDADHPDTSNNSVDIFPKFTLGGDRGRCYDGWHNWNQVQATPYDGRYAFPSADYIKGNALTPAQLAAGQTLVSLPTGKYVVEVVTPPGFQVAKEEDKNILIGDAFIAPAAQQFGALASIFILPDQATINNANIYAPNTGDPGFQSNPTSNSGWYGTSNGTTFPECVGSMHRVPDYLSLYPQAQQVAPFAGMDRPLCDRKLVVLNDQMQASAAFYVFTEVPLASNNTGIILNDATSEFNAISPDFGEKASVPFVPVSIKDFRGVEISRTYSDQWGAYNMMLPSSWLVNPPTPSGYGPNMLITCMNDPGPIPDPSGSGQMVVDPSYNPLFSNFCYTNPFMPGLVDYLDTPVLPIAAFASGYNPPDCAYPSTGDKTDPFPAILRVDSDATIGPWVPATGGNLTIQALGDQQVPNPAYTGPFSTTNSPSAQPKILRHYGFGDGQGKVTVGGAALAVTSWNDGVIKVQVPSGTPTGELSITTAKGKTTVDAVTVTVENLSPRYVVNGQAIQDAIDAANPGDLIIIDAGQYNELPIVWKPVRLQGVGAAAVVINASKFPSNKLDNWRAKVNRLFGINPVTGTQTLPTQVDGLPTQTLTGTSQLLEPTILGTVEGAGITVVGKNLPGKCGLVQVGSDSNFECARSRIDGLTVSMGDTGGGIYVNGWAHGLEISNNRVFGNSGGTNGGIRVGQPYLELLALPTDRLKASVIGQLGYDNHVNIHHNAVSGNGTVEAPLGAGGANTGIGAAGGGVSLCAGSDDYRVEHNWICGNYSASDGGGIGHIGFSHGGRIASNQILFNQSFQQSQTTNGGGIIVSGEPPLAGTLSLGTGSVTIDSNLIRGNLAESGHGGGIRLQQVNGLDVQDFGPSQWFSVNVTNNMIVNNVAGWSGGGISTVDAVASVIVNNTIASNDAIGIAGPITKGGVVQTLPAESIAPAGIGRPFPAGVAVGTTSAPLNTLAGSAARQLPTMANNIVWKNRSFFYDGHGGLCRSNDQADAAGANGTAVELNGCPVLPQQGTSGQCFAGDRYWDLGMLTDASAAAPSAGTLAGTYSMLTSTAGYTGAGLITSSTDPMHGLYCNGSRVVPELPRVINPASFNNIQVAATIDEGFNFINARYGPLYLINPTSGAAFGDYHIRGGSTAQDTGTLTAVVVASPPAARAVSAPDHDFDGLGRPQGPRFDIGANEISVPADLSVTKTDGVDIVFPGQTVTYTVVVTNRGPGAVSGATLTDTLPGAAQLHVTSWSCTATAGSCTAAGTGDVVRAGTVSLNADGIATYTLTGQVAGSALPGPLTNTAAIASANDPNPANNIASDTDTITLPVSDLAITNSDGVTNVQRGTTVTYSVVVTNRGPSDVTGAVVTDAKPAQFSSWSWSCAPVGAAGCGAAGNTGTGSINKTLATLANGASVTFTVNATVGNAAAPGPLVTTATVTVPSAGVNARIDPDLSNNTASDTDTVQVALAQLSPAGTTAFGNVQSGTASPSVVFTYTNTGNLPLTVNPISFSDAINYAVADGCSGASLANNGNSCAVVVAFNPVSAGAHRATLAVSAAGVANQSATLTGTGVVAAAWTPNPLSFGTLATSSAAVTLVATLTNSGAGPVAITALPTLTAQAGGGANFTLPALGSDTCTSGAIIPAGGTCAVGVRYTPGGLAVTHTANLNVGASGLAVTAGLTVTTVVPTISVSTLSVAFGPNSTLGGAVSQTVTVTNTGTVPVTFVTDTVTGANFTKGVDACAGASLLSGGNCSIAVVFTPTATNAATGSTARTGALAIASNAATAIVTLAGTATQAVVGFSGLQALAATPADRNLKSVTTTLTNNGTAPLYIGLFAMSPPAGTNPGAFSVVNATCPIGGATGLVAATSCNLTVTYQPPATGVLNTITSTLTLTDTGAFQTIQTRSGNYTGN